VLHEEGEDSYGEEFLGDELGIIVCQGIVASDVERSTQREFAATIFTHKAVILKE
jgi:hypothetical protein